MVGRFLLIFPRYRSPVFVINPRVSVESFLGPNRNSTSIRPTFRSFSRHGLIGVARSTRITRSFIIRTLLRAWQTIRYSQTTLRVAIFIAKHTSWQRNPFRRNGSNRSCSKFLLTEIVQRSIINYIKAVILIYSTRARKSAAIFLHVSWNTGDKYSIIEPLRGLYEMARSQTA